MYSGMVTVFVVVFVVVVSVHSGVVLPVPLVEPVPEVEPVQLVLQVPLVDPVPVSSGHVIPVEVVVSVVTIS
jgi:hypothetical protein